MRKLFSLLMAAIMLLVPMTGLAATPSEIMAMATDQGQAKTIQVTFTPGTLPVDDNIATPVNDFLSALGFTLTTAGDQTSGAVSLSGKDVVDFAVYEESGVSYIKSMLLGDTPVCLNIENVDKVIDLVANYCATTFEMDAAKVAVMKEQLKTAMAGTTVTVTDAADVDVQPIIDWITALIDKAETADVIQQPRDCDPAATVTTLTLTAEDLASFAEVFSGVVKANPSMLASFQNMGTVEIDGKKMTGEELLDNAADLTREHMAFYKDIPVTIYMDKDGAPVSITVNVEKKDGDPKVRIIDFAYSRTTTADGVGHAINMEVTKNAKTVAVTASVLADSEAMDLVTVNVVEKETGKDDLNALSFILHSDKAETDTTAHHQVEMTTTIKPSAEDSAVTMAVKADLTAAFDGKNATKDATIKFYVGGADAELFTMNVKVATADAPEAMDVSNAVHLDSMDDASFKTFVDGVSQTALMTALTAMQQLPASVLNIFSGMMGN